MLTQWIYIKNSDELAAYVKSRQDLLTLIGRINYQDSQVPGRFHVLNFGREFYWQVYRFPAPLPRNAFVAGYDTEENVPCYVGRIQRDTGEYLFGRVRPCQKKLEIALRSKVLEVLLFEILVINWIWIEERGIL
ncbi:Hypothetical predicted protein [Cloeon dipterum]|uniref:Uncharacterized protein n=1 Tax=Cloeon dipterum TaxID=197152 RepID=A0A8S1DDT5_9INSE|nr:Hypothetical predicted protein [Cloeon dipterum]